MIQALEQVSNATNILWNLPRDWRWRPLHEVTSIHDSGRKPVKKEERIPGSIPYCGANGVIDSVSGFTHEGNFVLLAEDGGSYGAGEASAYLMKGEFWANNHVHILKGLRDVLDDRWLVYALNYLDLTHYLTGATRPKLTQGAMRQIALPVPSDIDIQRRIVARIEALLAEVRSSRSLLNEMRRDAKRIINVALEQVFQKIATECKPELLSNGHIKHLTSGSRDWSKYANPSNIGPLFIRVGNVGFSRIDLTEVERLSLPSDLGEAERTKVSSGDVLVTITGTIGRCCMVPDDLEEAYINQHVALIRLEDDLDSRYLMWFVLSPSGGGTQTAAMQYGQTKPGLSLTNIRNLQLPVPSKLVQCQIVSYLDSIQSEVDRMLELMSQDAKILDLLEQSILERAFRGEL